ncbi:MAG TPA: sigma-54 dependent transcriptional regulator [Nitrosomonas sp.]|jgi:DNA-binding NtrC family response regulator|nr:sigma-54 dependent transcriptional regulator [Nitrosomonas sp.]HQU97882.1 sigma-54 dependent transcriptional regulator [Nitrosomonas sp.]HQX12999.1 sigma-54 dependent transcriptional regulator [Nitrosomonas sp.]HRB20223.1 sigma-54 dependent transcriptional regulator [Nitrosomonas sp.]HRB32530.1 sigma-54 dependent transcriptional regulator [Nitrosomonas sp.]
MITNNTILIVDDEIGIRELLSEILRDEGYRVALAENAEQAKVWRNKTRPDLVLLDIWMPDTDGITLLKDWASNGMLTMPVIMMSGHGTIDTAVEATRIGAFGYLEKPIPLQKLLSTVTKALRGGRNKPATVFSLASLGKGPLITELKKKLEQVVNLKAPLLLMGEPGVGVEICARFMHRPNTPWIEPETIASLAESPLDFLESARDGVLFLKEIGELNKLAQKGLLLLLSKLEKYNVRVICATSQSLAELTAQGNYHPKLFEILTQLTVTVPALRAHREDIPDLANQILLRCIESGEVSSALQFTTAALNCLRNYDWPGNLTQLTGVVHSLALTCTSEEITAEAVQQAMVFPESSSVSALPEIPLDLSLREARDLFEKSYFERLIGQENGNMTRVADRAGLERTHLYRKIKMLGIKLRGN